jgi:hypothetical protein
VGVVNVIADITRQPFAAGVHGGLARAELLGVHLLGLEIIIDVVTHPQFIARLDAHMAVSMRLVVRGVHGDGIRGQDGVLVTDAHGIGAGPELGGRVVFHLPVRGQRFDLQTGGILGLERKRNQPRGGEQREDGGKFDLQARPIKQNAATLPSGF